MRFFHKHHHGRRAAMAERMLAAGYFGTGFGRDGFGRGGFGGAFGGRGFGGGDHHGHGRRGRRGRFDADSLRLILLKLIAEAPRHGYDLIRDVEARSGGIYAPSPGVVYPTLTMLADLGHAEEQPEAGGKKLYAITEAGTTHLEEEAEAVARAFERLEALGAMGNRTNGAPIRRAMENLKAALRERLVREGATDDTMLDVAAIIDEAAQKIERLK